MVSNKDADLSDEYPKSVFDDFVKHNSKFSHLSGKYGQKFTTQNNRKDYYLVGVKPNSRKYSIVGKSTNPSCSRMTLFTLGSIIFLNESKLSTKRSEIENASTDSDSEETTPFKKSKDETDDWRKEIREKVAKLFDMNYTSKFGKPPSQQKTSQPAKDFQTFEFILTNITTVSFYNGGGSYDINPFSEFFFFDPLNEKVHKYLISPKIDGKFTQSLFDSKQTFAHDTQAEDAENNFYQSKQFLLNTFKDEKIESSKTFNSFQSLIQYLMFFINRQLEQGLVYIFKHKPNISISKITFENINGDNYPPSNHWRLTIKEKLRKLNIEPDSILDIFNHLKEFIFKIISSKPLGISTDEIVSKLRSQFPFLLDKDNWRNANITTILQSLATATLDKESKANWTIKSI